MMETVEEWLESVEDKEVRELLLERMEWPLPGFSTIKEAINCGFSWHKAKEGEDFWDRCFESPDPIAYLRAHLDSQQAPADQPTYYGQGSPHEVVAFIDAHVLNFHRGNAVKYIARAGKKDPAKEVEDLKKAIHYLQMEVEKLQK